jgi:hypothetical protein
VFPETELSPQDMEKTGDSFKTFLKASPGRCHFSPDNHLEPKYTPTTNFMEAWEMILFRVFGKRKWD